MCATFYQARKVDTELVKLIWSASFFLFNIVSGFSLILRDRLTLSNHQIIIFLLERVTNHLSMSQTHRLDP